MPSKIVGGEKRPMQTPQREWLKNARNGWVGDILNSSSFKNRQIFDYNVVKTMYNEYNNGNFDNSFFLWQWLNLEIWFM